MNKKTFAEKHEGEPLFSKDWNELTGYTNEIVDAVNQSGGGSGLPNFYINSKGNLNIETSPEIGNTSKGKINIEAMDDIQFKPGDDIVLYSHHRAQDKQDEVMVKIMDGTGKDDIPVKLQLNTSEINLTTKVDDNTDGDDLNVRVNCNTNKRGYLKVRARAIDLRCEDHGGIAIQPKGQDSSNNENKIKFEHGGGDGLEFGTFNTKKTSIYTNEYRFRKDGIWKMATRTSEESDKPEPGDPTTYYKYVKQADDFYDIIDPNDATCTTRDIIKTAAALNGTENIHTHITSKGNLEIESLNIYYAEYINSSEQAPTDYYQYSGTDEIDEDEYYTEADIISILDQGEPIFEEDWSTTSFWVINQDNVTYTQWRLTKIAAPDINIESDSDVKITAGKKIKLGGQLDFGSTFNFGETDNGIETQYKLTAKNKTKDCGIIKVVGVNNHSSNNLVVNDVTIAPGTSQTVAQASSLDIVRLGAAFGFEKVYIERDPVVVVEELTGTPEYDAEHTSSAANTFFVDGEEYYRTDLLTANLGGHINAVQNQAIINVGKGVSDSYTIKITYNSTDVHYYKFTKAPSDTLFIIDSNNKARLSDIVKLTKYMKTHGEGPWSNQ